MSHIGASTHLLQVQDFVGWIPGWNRHSIHAVSQLVDGLTCGKPHCLKTDTTYSTNGHRDTNALGSGLQETRPELSLFDDLTTDIFKR